ncbi:MAG: ParB/RepB/Spo0J family partition protein [Oscillatoria sp. PMC 1068.18]|nr:ParB/RepB/Spo0J family partition protein [Oscillatoria sp. PMC 1068.18]
MSKRRSVQSFIASLPTEPETTLTLEEIVLPGSQPRRYFDPEKLKQLAASIQQYGILEPLLVRPRDSNYELVAGERRYRAAKMVGLLTVPVVIRTLTDEEALALSLVENLAREDLNPVEETEGILLLLGIELNLEKTEVISLLYRMENERKGKATYNVMGSETAEKVNELFSGLGQNWQSFVSNKLPILKLPKDILQVLNTGRIGYTKAKALAKVKDDSQRRELTFKAISTKMSLSEIKEMIAQLGTETSSREVSFSASFQKRVNDIFKFVRANQVFDNPEKIEQIEQKLAELEALILPSSPEK